MSAHDYLIFFKRFKWTLLCCPLIAGALGYVVSSQKKDLEKFQVKLLPHKKGTKQLFHQQSIGIAPSTVVHIARSKAVLKSAHDGCSPEVQRHFSLERFRAVSSCFVQDDIVTIEVELDLHTQFGALMANRYAATLSEHLLNVEQQRHEQQLRDIEFSINENTEEHRKITAEIRLLLRMESARDGNSPRDQANTTQRLQTLISERRAAISAYDAQLKELNRALKLPSDAHTIAWLSPQHLNRLRTQQTKLAQLNRSHSKTSPVVNKAQNELNAIKRHIYGQHHPNVVFLEETATNRSLYSQVNTIREKREAYQQTMNLLISQKNHHLARLNSQSGHLKNTLEKLELRAKLLENFFARLKKAKVETHLKNIGSVPPFAAIEPCSGPVQTAPEHGIKTIALFTVGGFAFSLLSIAAIKNRRHAPSKKHDLLMRYQSPVLGTFPWMQTHHLKTPSRARSQLDETVAYLKHNVETCGHPSGKKSIFICSPSQGEGKSTIASHLAKTFANEGNKTLLMSADLRKAMALTEDVEISEAQSIGLGECLAEGRPLEDGVYPSRTTSNLDVVPNIRRQVNPSRLLASAHFDNVFNRAKQTYDTVIVDTPAILPVVDACSCLPKADCVILIACAEKTRYKELDQTADRLKNLGINIDGFILNGGHEKLHGYGH